MFRVMTLLASFFSLFSSDIQEKPPERWVVYYNDQASPSAFDPYALVVLDNDYHPNIAALREKGKIVLGYLSLGEVNQERAFFQDVKKDGILLQENPHWPGSFFVDLRSPLWTKRVIEELIPQILQKKFHGIFIDTMDNAAEMERQDAETFKGMVDAAATLIKKIRQHYPEIEIMLNRGYEILPHVRNEITMALGESLYTDYNFEKKTYDYIPENLYQEQVSILKKAQKQSSHLKIYTLDYWKGGDSAALHNIYKKQRENGFIPYVSTIDLHTIVPEPK